MGGLQGAICVPSRAMLMTGRTLFHLTKDGAQIAASDVTLPEALRGAGYKDFAIGKWHNSIPSLTKAFSDGGTLFFGGMTKDQWAVPLQGYPKTAGAPQAEAPAKRQHSSEAIADEAVQFISDYRGAQPFLLYVAFLAPHDPRQAPEEYMRMYDPATIPVPDNFLPKHPFDNGELQVRDEKLLPFPRTKEAVQREIAAYYACISHVDAQIGRVLETLKVSDRLDNTIIVFAGDNGLAVGQHGLLGKQNLYDHSVRVPLVFSGPGIARGERRDQLCYLSDVMPTICELTGVAIPANVDTTSLAPAIRDASAAGRSAVFFAYKQQQRGIRDDRYKLIEYRVNGVAHTQLFDMRADPKEITNLVDESAHADTLARLRKSLRQHQDDLNDPAAGGF
jgi:arylsulfatase A-like enzyme